MQQFLKRLFNRETIAYMFFGVLTTVVNYLVFWLFIAWWGEGFSLLANTVAFIVSVFFAYLTNKIFVFQSKSWKKEVLVREVLSFVSARLLSFGFEELGLLICISLNVGAFSLWGISGIMIAKILLSFIVVIINYVISKLLIFKSKEQR